MKTPGKKLVMSDKVLIDTSVWVEFFRKKGSIVSIKVKEYLRLNQACYTGPIMIELYQGAKTHKELQILDQLFQSIPYIEITHTHYYRAGLISQRAAREGKIFSTVDMILAILAHDEKVMLFSLDNHFKEISKYCSLSLVKLSD